MKTVEKIEITSQSPGETKACGEKIGRMAYPGLFIALRGDFGCGKTTFTQGFARGISVPPDYYITSPTYTLINEYPGKYRLFHVDLYRLSGLADIDDIGLYDIPGSESVVLIEWPERLHENDLPSGRLEIQFTMLDDRSRHILLTAYGRDAGNLIINYVV